MSDDIAMTVRFDADEAVIEFPDDHVTVSVPATPVGDRLYRLDGVPIFVESAAFGDVIEAEPSADGRLRFARVAEPGGWRTFDFILSPHNIDSENGRWLLRELEARGGHWELVFGGLLFVCVPPGVDLDPEPWTELVD